MDSDVYTVKITFLHLLLFIPIQPTRFFNA